MSTANPSLSIETLLEHERFVRGIARGLLRDPHAADDVVQDTWLRALQRGPRALGAMRAWLGSVAQRRALDVRRGGARRQRRELALPGAEAAEPVHVSVERLELQRDLVAAVLALGEPYRGVVVLRYLHGLEPTAIAARLRSKPATVRTQLVRAHALLRERLDQHRERAAWSALLLPLAGAPRLELPAAPLLAGGLVAAAALGAFYLQRHDPAPLPPAGVTSAVAALTPAAGDRDTPQQPQPQPRVAVPQPQEPTAAVSPAPEVPSPRAVLFDQQQHKNYEDAAFSFERAYGGRERKGKNKTRNDWDVVLQGNRLRVNTVTDDRSVIADLGALPLAELARRPLAELELLVRDAALERFDPARAQDGRAGDRAFAQLGHSYFVWTEDTDSDVASLFEVVELEPGDRCVLDWHSTEDGTFARGSVRSPAGARTLAQAALALRAAAVAAMQHHEGPLELKQPRAVLQVRTGAAGGNPCRVELGRAHSQYVDRLAAEPLSLDPVIGIHEDTVGYAVGGLIPLDRRFVVTGASWQGIARGDGNGRSYFRVKLGDETLVNAKGSDEPIRGSWNGRVEIVRGQEDRVFLELSNSSVGELVLTGTFEPLAK